MFTCHSHWSKALQWFAYLTLGSIAGTILTKYTGLSPSYIPQVASIILILCGVCVVAQSIRPIYLLAGVLVLGVVVEIVGIYKELPFGSYLYTNKWWPTILLPEKLVDQKPGVSVHFPLQLPFAWLMIVGGSYASLGKLHEKRWLRILAAALMATVIDFFMEEVMVRVFKYWTWTGSPSVLPGGAPLVNSVGWFGVSLVGAYILSFNQRERDNHANNESATMLTFYSLLMLLAFVFQS